MAIKMQNVPSGDYNKAVPVINRNFLELKNDITRLELVREGTITVPAYTAPTVVQESYDHNLGYTPVAIVYYENSPGNRSPLPYFSAGLAGSSLSLSSIHQFFCDDDSLTISIATEGFSTLGDTTYKFYLLKAAAD